MSKIKLTKPAPNVSLSSKISDVVKTTTCYMCACRCGIKVHLSDGKIRYIEGNPDHPVNGGVLCAKGSAGIMHQNSPGKLTKPLKRVGERGKGEFVEIEWDEALDIATDWLGTVKNSDPKKLAFFTGRDQSQSFTGWWAAKFGTPNYAAHGGFCSVNMAAAGLYSIGGSFWEFGEPDFENTKLFIMFGVAEDHDSNPIKIGLGKLKNRENTKFISVNPIRTGYSSIADEWIAIKPGTDGLFVSSIINYILKENKFDSEFLIKNTNSAWLVIDNPGTDEDGLFFRDKDGNPVCFDENTNGVVSVKEKKIKPQLEKELITENGLKLRTAFCKFKERFNSSDLNPENVAKEIGLSAETITRISEEIIEAAYNTESNIKQKWTDVDGVVHSEFKGRAVSFHAMRGISAHTNGFHTCRIIHTLQMLIGAIDVPGAWRYKAPFPKPMPGGPAPANIIKNDDGSLKGMPLGFPQSPEDLLLDENDDPIRIDKAYTWEYPIAAHGLMHSVLRNAWLGDPYKIDVLFMYMANMAWNSSMATNNVHSYLTDKDEQGNYKIPKIIYSDAFYSETVAYADLVLPDTTYLERWDCVSILDRPIGSADGPADAIRQPILEPDRDVKPFQDVLLKLGERLKLPGFTDQDGNPSYPGGYSDYLANHERTPGVGPLAGFRGQDGSQIGIAESNIKQLQKYIDNGCFWSDEFSESAKYNKYENSDYLQYAKKMGWVGSDDTRITLQFYSETFQKFRLAAEGYGKRLPPLQLRDRIRDFFDPIPFWYPPFEDSLNKNGDYPLHAVTQRPMHMYHSWGGQNQWLRQITSENFLFIHRDLAKQHNLKDGDWAILKSAHNQIRVRVKSMDGVNKNTVWTWNAIAKKKNTWGLDDNARESKDSFLLNDLISDLLPKNLSKHDYANSDPVTGQAAWYDLRVSIEKSTKQDDNSILSNTTSAIKPISEIFSKLSKAMDIPKDKVSSKEPEEFIERVPHQPQSRKEFQND